MLVLHQSLSLSLSLSLSQVAVRPAIFWREYTPFCCQYAPFLVAAHILDLSKLVVDQERRALRA